MEQEEKNEYGFKNILCISSNDECTRVEFNCDGEKELMMAAVSLCQLFEKHEEFLEAVEFVISLKMSDKKFSDIVDKSEMEIPDFNQLLK